jgi:hypothetical protein
LIQSASLQLTPFAVSAAEKRDYEALSENCQTRGTFRKMKNAPKELPSIPPELVDQFVKGPMTAEAVQDAATAFLRTLPHFPETKVRGSYKHINSRYRLTLLTESPALPLYG